MIQTDVKNWKWHPAGAQKLPDGRMHLHHGPIDIIAEAFGEPRAVGRTEYTPPNPLAHLDN